MLSHALAWHNAGCAPMPLRRDGSKAPWVDDWRIFIDEPPTQDEIRAIFARRNTSEGVGIICGKASGNLEMLELEGRAIAEGLLDEAIGLLNDHDLGDVWQKINTGYVEDTPSGGVHWYFRVDGDPMHNTKIASRPGEGDKIDVLIETRGEGGFSVVAPSGGHTHETGRPWQTRAGTPENIPTITETERDALYAILAMLDEMPEAEPDAGSKGPSVNILGGVRPGDDFNAKATWSQILEGWQCVHHFGGKHYGWRRPGKDAGISATTGRNDGDNLYVFSTSTVFQDWRPYSKFAAYAILNHKGDYSAAAKALSDQGYGQAPPVSPPPPQSPPRLHVVDGTSARQADPAPSPKALHADQYGPTEDGTARMLIDAHAHELRYCPQMSKWLTWNGHRWERDDKNWHRELILAIARTLPDEKGWGSYKRRALSATGVSGISRLAESNSRIVVNIDDLDANPYELNTPGGIIDLRSGELRAPDPSSLHTRVTNAIPDFEADSSVLDQFLTDTFPDQELRAYVRRLLGLSIIGTVLENILPFGYGIGANGKTTLYEAVAHALGTGVDGYAISAPSEMLMQRRHGEHPAELAQLASARLVTCSELDDGQRFAEARVKMLTGSDSINARFMRGNPFTFKPSHTLHLLGNHKPSAVTGGPAFWRRVQLIPYDHVVPEGQRDPMLGEKLAAAAPVVLAWIARGAAEYLSDGLRIPAIVQSATDDYAADQDTIGRFVADECHRASSETVSVKTGVLRDAYERWCIEMGEEPVSAKRLTGELTERFGVGTKRTGSARFYTGIALLKLDDDSDGSVTDEQQAWWQK